MSFFTVFMLPKKAYRNQLPSFQMIVDAELAQDACYSAKTLNARVSATVDARYRNIYAEATPINVTTRIE